MTVCEDCNREYEGSGTCPHCEAEVAHPYESVVNSAAGGFPLAILGNLLIFVGLLPVMLMAWNWFRISALLAGAGGVCHIFNQIHRRAWRWPP